MIIGIDPGTKWVGFAVYDDSGKRLLMTSELKVLGSNLYEKLTHIRESVQLLCASHPASGAVVEKMFMNNKGAASLIAAQIVIVDTLKECGLSVVEYAPMTWQKFMGKGGMEKSAACEKIIDVFGNVNLIDETKAKPKMLLNASDASALAICGAANAMSETLVTSYDTYIQTI